jgi:hypothetical protein
MGWIILILIFLLVIETLFIIGINDSLYRYAVIKHKFKKHGYDCCFIVMYMDVVPKTKTIKVTEEVYSKFNVDDYITFYI